MVELLLPVWHLTSKLAAANCLDAFEDNKDPIAPLQRENGDGGPTSSPTGAFRPALCSRSCNTEISST